MTPARQALVASQDAARERFEGTVSETDVKLLATRAVPESKYAREYAQNLAAIDNLVQAIEHHPMNAAPELDGQAVSRQDYVRQLIAETEGGLALLDQEEKMLGFMAKLVALDARALEEEVIDLELLDSDVPEITVVSAVGFFVGN